MSDWQVVAYDLTVSEVQGIHEVVVPEKIIQVLSARG